MSDLHRGGASLTVGWGALPTPAQRWLVRAAVGPVDEIENSLREWRALVDLSGPIDGGSYRLIPLVFHRLQAAGLDDPNRGMFKGVYRRSMVENNGVLNAVSPALHAFERAGIVPWLSKGAGLVQAGYYPTVAARPMADVDIVVASSQRDQAIAAVRTLGYRPRLSEREMVDLHGATFVDPAGRELDLHWHHLHHVRSDAADEIITRASQPAQLDGVAVRVPGPTGLLIVNAVHGMIPNAEPPVRWLVDAARVLDRDGDLVVWDDIVAFASRFRMARRIERAFALLAETTGRSAPDSTMAALRALPTSAVERLESRMSTVPWNSVRAGVLQVLSGYAGGDRELRRVVTRLPPYLSRRWNVDGVHTMPVVGTRKLIAWIRKDDDDPR